MRQSRDTMTQEEAELIIKLQEYFDQRSVVLKWFDILALMIIGYWLGNWIDSFWWYL